jgi:hypothetical protein
LSETRRFFLEYPLAVSVGQQTRLARLHLAVAFGRCYQMTSPQQPSVGAQASLEFSIARSKAINTYAALESMMALLFAHLMQADERKSYFVFSRLIAPREKRKVVSKLMQLSYPNAHSIFFKSLMRRIGELDDPRNRIVHWMAINRAANGEQIGVYLRDHPNIYSGELFEIKEINDFIEKTDFLQLALFYFTVYLKHLRNLSTDPEWLSWREIFRQQCRYPPPMDHPLVLMRKAQPARPRSSPA